MIFLLDTNAVAALSVEDPRFMARRVGYRPRDFGISSIVTFEFMFGAYRHPQTQKYLDIYAALQLEVVPFEPEDARAAGRIRAELQTRGTPIGPYDVLIAGQALARDLILITRNTREFARVDGLRVENWME